MRILFLTTANNSLSQRLFIELTERGHEVRVCVVANGQDMIDAVSRNTFELIICPMLKAAVPEEVWSKHVCLIVHPGVKGDWGPSSLDWAISTAEKIWGVTILQAATEVDAGPIWASRTFSLPSVTPTKSSLYRQQVTEAAVQGVLEAVEKFRSGIFQPEPLDYSRPDVFGSLRPNMQQSDRTIDWARDDTATIVRKIRAADSAPGVLSTLHGISCFLYGAHEEDLIKGQPGKALAKRDGAICVGTVDGAVWISHLKAKGDPKAHPEACHLFQSGLGCDHCDQEICTVAGVKLPATQVLGPLLRGVPEAPLSIDAPTDHRTYREIVYREEGLVGYLSFDFYNGAMSTDQCRRLRDAFLYARSRPTKVIVLLGGRDFWSNGIHLNTIEASVDPAGESWRNINAIDDLVYEIVTTMSHLVISSLRGNAGAGGVILALAADRVYARAGIVINPHYRSMGGLYGSEYWTYLLPRRVGPAKAIELTQACQPIGTRAAFDIGLLDGAFCDDVETFEDEIRTRAASLANSPDVRAMLIKKHERRLDDELIKPLSSYRSEELAHMKVNFFGPDPAYHDARRRFVFKGNPAPPNIQAAVGSQIRVEARARPNETQQLPRDLSSSSGTRQASGYARLPESREVRARPSATLGARVLKALRQGIGALPSWRDQ